MTTTHISGRTAQAVRNKAKSGIVITKIKKTTWSIGGHRWQKYNGMNLYSVTYHKKK